MGDGGEACTNGGGEYTPVGGQGAPVTTPTPHPTRDPTPVNTPAPQPTQEPTFDQCHQRNELCQQDSLGFHYHEPNPYNDQPDACTRSVSVMASSDCVWSIRGNFQCCGTDTSGACAPPCRHNGRDGGISFSTNDRRLRSVQLDSHQHAKKEIVDLAATFTAIADAMIHNSVPTAPLASQISAECKAYMKQEFGRYGCCMNSIGDYLHDLHTIQGSTVAKAEKSKAWMIDFGTNSGATVLPSCNLVAQQGSAKIDVVGLSCDYLKAHAKEVEADIKSSGGITGDQLVGTLHSKSILVSSVKSIPSISFSHSPSLFCFHYHRNQDLWN